ncbi:MAG: transposon-encoded TnpW family protein [Oscillibacter sp.]|nr:transposon-encoded TnpW family protein [Oscillibacter sp.]
MTQINSNPDPKFGSIHRSIRGTEYIVTGFFNPAATETADEKIIRLILLKAGFSSIIEAPITFAAAQKKGVQHE